MNFNKFFALAALVIAPLSQAAYVTINEAGMDAVYSQVSFGNTPVDIRIGATTTIVNAGLLDIDTPAKLNSLFGSHVGAQDVVNFYFVDTISECGGFNVNIIGCGETPGNDFVVESVWAANTTIPSGGNITYGVNLLAHELGHNLGLQHRNGTDLMNPFINGFQDLNAAEVATILASPLVHKDANGNRFITINPVLIVARAINNVPEPSTLVLMLSGLAIVGVRARKSKAQAQAQA